jgi:hypothetical protein
VRRFVGHCESVAVPGAFPERLPVTCALSSHRHRQRDERAEAAEARRCAEQPGERRAALGDGAERDLAGERPPGGESQPVQHRPGVPIATLSWAPLITSGVVISVRKPTPSSEPK